MTASVISKTTQHRIIAHDQKEKSTEDILAA